MTLAKGAELTLGTGRTTNTTYSIAQLCLTLTLHLARRLALTIEVRICCSADLLSRLLLSPLELRLQIHHFALPSHFHVHLQAAGLLLSECLGPSHPAKDGSANDFETDGFGMFLDRPTSVIGRATTRTHWRCEVAAMSDVSQGRSWMKTLCICKQMWVAMC